MPVDRYRLANSVDDPGVYFIQADDLAVVSRKDAAALRLLWPIRKTAPSTEVLHNLAPQYLPTLVDIASVAIITTSRAAVTVDAVAVAERLLDALESLVFVVDDSRSALRRIVPQVPLSLNIGAKVTDVERRGAFVGIEVHGSYGDCDCGVVVEPLCGVIET